jgi:diketogulonate reductase-like aldo/keto reductase
MLAGMHRTVSGVRVPAFLYGTAWKEERTEALTRAAISSGFSGIDTANQRRHYVEADVGRAVADAIGSNTTTRDALFLQTKFTFSAGQDHRLPYDADVDVAVQVRQSFESSLEHLRTTVLDSYVLHGPSSRRGLTQTDWAAWRAMESIADSGGARLLGVSNVSLEQLERLHRDARVKPSFVQNRCYAATGWDRAVRAFCNENGILYQGFSLLTANVPVVESDTVHRFASRLGKTPAQVVYRFAIQVGMIALTGTTNEQHMAEALACAELELAPSELETLESIAG